MQQSHVDHIIPFSKGGKHHQDNLQVLTAAENIRQGSKMDYQAEQTLIMFPDDAGGVTELASEVAENVKDIGSDVGSKDLL